MPTVGHPGRDRTLASARTLYYCPSMRVDIDRYLAQCISCSKHKCTTKGASTHAKISTIRMPLGHCFNRFSQLPVSCQGSQYRLMCVDHLSRFVVLAPVKNNTAASTAHALGTHLICPYITSKILLTDNEAKFRNCILAEICNQYNIIQTFRPRLHGASSISDLMQ